MHTITAPPSIPVIRAGRARNGRAGSGSAAQRTLAIVLAGGRGKRLHQLTARRSKPALPFAGELRLIDFPLSNCVNSGIRRVAVLTQYKAQSLIRHIERGWGFLSPLLAEYIDVVPAQQQLGERWYRGTADAVFQNLDIVRDADPDWVLILGGDHVYKMDYARLLADHIASGAEVTVACLDVPLGDATGFGVVGVDDRRRIVSFQEKPAQPEPMPGRPDRALASMGIYLFNASLLCELLDGHGAGPGQSLDFGHDVIPALVGRSRLLAHDFADSCVGNGNGGAYWRDVGTVDAYWEASMDLTRASPDLDLNDDHWPVLSHRTHMPPAKFVDGETAGRSATMVDSVVSGGCVIHGSSVRRSILCSRVSVGEGSEVEESVLLPGVAVGRRVRLRRTVVDAGCVLPDGFSAGVHPAEDRAHFHVTSNGITLITPEMLGQQWYGDPT